MAATDHLGPQFYKYRPAQEEGREASHWLSTNAGHDWQDRNITYDTDEDGNMSFRNPVLAFEPGNGFFSLKKDIEHTDGWDQRGYNSNPYDAGPYHVRGAHP